MNEQSEELKKQVKEILDAMKKRDDENAAVLKKTAEDVAAFGKIQEGTKDAVAAINAEGQKLQGRMLEVEQKLAELKTNPGPVKDVTLGEKVVTDPKFKEFAALAKSKGNHSQRFELKSYGLKQITSIDSSGGAGIWSTRLPGVIEEPLRPLSIRDLLDQGSTDSNLIEWVRENVYTNEADVVSEGALKPESNITYERLDVPVRTIAHWIRASKQVLADFKQLQTMINGRMRWGLRIKEEDEILYGDGTGEHLLGLIPQATDYNTTLNRTGDTFIDVIRHAILQVRLAFYPASGIVVSPTDWHNIELTKDNENRYLMASPQGRIPAMLWGLPVVESDGMATSGEFLVGAFRLAATLFDREEAAILLSTEDRDNFIRNLVTILAEERLALAVTRPRAFVHGSFPSGSTT